MPLPNEIFGALNKLGAVNWKEHVRSDKGPNFTERPRIALLLGTVIAELRTAGTTITGAAVRERLASQAYQGVVTTYRSDGKGNMAHEAEIVCFDGTDRVPKPAARYAVTP